MRRRGGNATSYWEIEKGHVTSGTGFETVNAILQGLKGGNKRGNLSLKLNDSLRSGGIAGAGFGEVLLQE
jgi:hypothetical protein